MAAVADIAELVRREAGIVLPVTRETAILAAVNRAAPGLGPDAFLRAASGPVRGRVLVERLIDEVTVQETAFVRDRAQFDAIPWSRLLHTAHAAGSEVIRVWSAGCATGEEAYTLALLAAEAFAPAPPPVDVLGTDIAGTAVAAATIGRYRERSVRALDPALRERYLHREDDGSFMVGDQLRRLVRLARHNLARDPIPPLGEPGFDLIACRNVLIYIDPLLGRQVIESLERALRPDGLLLLGAADALRRAPGPPLPVQPAGLALAPKRRLRRPLGTEASLSREQRLAAALAAADQGDHDAARAHVASLLAASPLDSDAHYIDGLVTLGAGWPARAAAALRRALYADASFGLAAFTLGRAYAELGDNQAARRAYEQALRTLDPEDDRHRRMLQQVDIGDIAAACRAWLSGQS
jgi:chemotaxis methyl-accepting protein methylase